MRNFGSINYQDLVVPEHRERVSQIYINQFRERRPTSYVEFPFFSKSGEIIWFGQNTTLVMEGDKIVGFHIIARDITLRKKAEQALSESEQRYRNLVENAPDVIYTLAPDGTITSLNPAFETITGWPRSDWLYKNFTSVLHPDDLPQGLELFQRIMKGGKIAPFELRVLKKSGDYLVAEFTVTPQTQNGSVIGMLGIARDITEHKKAEDELRAEKERFRLAAESSTDLIYEWDIKERVDWFGKIDELLGYAPNEFPRTFEAWGNSVHPDDRDRVMAAVKNHLEKNEPYDVEYRVRKKDGTYNYWWARGTAVRDEKGNTYRWVGAVSDITERRRAEDALRASENKYRILIENVPQKIFLKDKNAVYISCNENYAHDLKIKSDEISGKTDYDFYPKELAEKYRADDKKIIERGRTEEVEEKYIRNGQEVWVNTIKTPVKDEKGNLVGILGIFWDITDRKKAEESLRESVETLRAFLNANPEVSFLMDAKGTVLVANESLFKRFSKNSEEIIGSCLYDLFPEDVTKKRKYHFDEVFRTGKPVHFEDVRMDRNYETFVHPVFDKEGNVAEVAVLGFDITERKQTEEALRSSEEKYRTILENIEEGYYEVDIAGNFTFLNESMCRIYGYLKEELMGMNDRQYTDKENAKRLFETFNKVYRTGEPQIGYDYKIIRKDGANRYVETSILLQKDSSGKPLGFRGIIRDITDRKLAEESLRQSEENARQLARDNAAVAEIGRIISSTLNIDEIYESFSAEVKKIIPFDRIVIDTIDTEKSTVRNVYIAGKGLQDRNVKDIYPLEGSGNAEMVRTRSTLLIQTKDFSEYKDRFPMLLSTFQAGFRSIMNVPLFSKGEIIGGLLLRSRKPYAYTDKDVRLAERIGFHIAGAIANAQLYAERIHAEEERLALQDQLRQSQKMEAIGQLAGGVAHDFNNILTVIKGYSQLSLTEIKESDPLKENIEEVKKAADRAADLTRQLLAFSRRQIMEMKILDLNDLVKNLDKMLRRIIGEDIELVTLLAEDLGRVNADPGQIEQVIINLAVNARDAMPKGGKLTIETADVELDEEYARAHIAVKPGAYVMLSVSDSGMGMTKEIQDRVFEPFFTTKEKGKGTGLGLSTVYGIVKQIGGNIWVYSEPEKGTTLKIYLPQVNEPLEEMREKVVKDELPRGNETILIVEDEEDVLKLAGRVLSRQGYTVLETTNGGEALKVCREQKEPIHLILTDVVMPQMSGRELIERCREIRQDFKAIYMSGYTDDTVTHHGILEKGMNYIQKPFTIEGLTRKVREVLE